jgi:hypothetical protein
LSKREGEVSDPGGLIGQTEVEREGGREKEKKAFINITQV